MYFLRLFFLPIPFISLSDELIVNIDDYKKYCNCCGVTSAFSDIAVMARFPQGFCLSPVEV